MYRYISSPNHQPAWLEQIDDFDVRFLRELEPLKPESGFTPEGIENQNRRFAPTG